MSTRKIDDDGVPYWEKRSFSRKDYTVTWTDWLAEVGQVIASVSCIAPSGINLVSQSNTSTTHSVFISGGTDGTDYDFVSRIFTASRWDEKKFRIKVKD